MKYTYLGKQFYEKHNYKESLSKAYNDLNYIGVIFCFPLVYLHEILHWIPAKLFGFNPELRLLKPGEYPAYCRIHIKNTDNKYKAITVFVFPVLIPIYVLGYNLLCTYNQNTVILGILLLTLSLNDIVLTVYLLIYDYKKLCDKF